MEIADEGEAATSVEEVAGSPPHHSTQTSPGLVKRGRDHPQEVRT